MSTGAAFSSISNGFASFINRIEGREVPQLTLAVKLLCEAVKDGHVCLDLNDIVQGETTEYAELAKESVVNWTIAEWVEQLRTTRVVGSPGSFHPLILDNSNRLYLYRYHAYEQTLAQGIRDRSEKFIAEGLERLTDKIDQYFDDRDQEVNWQKIAALVASTRPFCVISGGPGTGKTTTVVKILAMLLEMAADQPLSIALAAPTGKAAARLKTSITKAKSDLPCTQDVLEKIPEDVSTLHRLLGSIRNSPSFRHNATNPLHYDIVVIDEASMVDLPMMAKLIYALPEHARLILLGDKNQLSSVEAGAVLGDICHTGTETPYSKQMQSILGSYLGLHDQSFDHEETGPGDSLVTLQKTYRFETTSGIGRLSMAVNAGLINEALNLLNDPEVTDIHWLECPAENQIRNQLKQRILDGFTPYLEANGPEEALLKFSRFMLLCALRNGPFGVSAITPLAEQILAEQGVLKPGSRWYRGRPIMITANDYNLGLFNGDTGILWPDDSPEKKLRAYFPDQNGQLRSLAPARLPAHDTAFATTVHKSQGSEFDRVLLLLPSQDSRALTRELIYTGITRAKRAVEIWGRQDVFSLALQRRIKRTSGLKDAIWGD